MRKLISKILLVAIVAVIIINFTAVKTYKLTAFDVELDVTLSTNPVTELQFPPIGKLRANTHWLPVDLKMTLKAIHQEKLATIIADLQSKEDLFALLQERGRIILRFFLLRLIFLGILGGMIGAGLGEVSYYSFITGGLVGILVVLVCSTIVYYSYDVNQFQDPDFEGMLDAAPWMLGLIEEGLSDIKQLGYEIELIASNMSTLFNKVEGLRPLSRVAGDFKVLHVSDIHNNPLAVRLIEQIIDSFAVDFVIDTGDITDYASPLEANLLKGLDKLTVPYIFIPGNHDSPQIIDKLNRFANLEVIKEDVIEVKGLKIVGLEDPSAQSDQVEPLAGKELVDSQRKLTQLVADLEKKPDIVAVHQFELAKPILDKVPLVIHGHNHSFKIYEKKGAIIINAGTTGAAGIRGLKDKEGIPYSVALLHFKKEHLDFNLKFVDIIKFYNRHSGFILERRLIE
ncbi:MAG: metallophosphoesterase family protein [Bacillota bacterium]